MGAEKDLRVWKRFAEARDLRQIGGVASYT